MLTSVQPRDSRFRFAFDPIYSEYPIERYNTILAESKHFLAIPSLGSIVKNWVLIVPRWNVVNFSQIPSKFKPELDAFIDSISRILGSESGHTYLFEHGATDDSDLSCGVYQAHLHLVNLEFDLAEASKEALPGKWRETAALLPPHDIQGPYFFVSDLATECLVANDIPITSQWFRKIIARLASRDDEWDYRKFAHSNNVEETINTFEKAIT